MKALSRFLIVMSASLWPHASHAASLELIFCSADTAVLKYEVTNEAETVSIKVRDIDTTTNASTFAAGSGQATLENNYAAAWSGSNNNIEALFVNASGVQVGAVARCPE